MYAEVIWPNTGTNYRPLSVGKQIFEWCNRQGTARTVETVKHLKNNSCSMELRQSFLECWNSVGLPPTSTRFSASYIQTQITKEASYKVIPWRRIIVLTLISVELTEKFFALYGVSNFSKFNTLLARHQ